MVVLKLAAVLTAASTKALPFLEKLGKFAKTNMFTFKNMGKTMNAALGTVKKFGIAAIAAMAGIGFTSPSAQAAFARMKKPIFDISETLGKALKPGLEQVGVLLQKVSGWLSENTWFTDLLSKSFETLVGWLGSAGDKFAELMENPFIKKTLEFVIDVGGKLGNWLIDNAPFTLLGLFLGSRLGFGGMLAGGALGALIDTGINLGQTNAKIQTMADPTIGAYDIGSGGEVVSPINININGTVMTNDLIEMEIGSQGTPWG